jgi:type IV pilus assembly protein PilO
MKTLEMKIPEIDFSSLEVREIGTWPLILRVAIVAAAGILSILVVYFFIIESKVETLDLQEAQMLTKRTEFKDKYTMAVNLDAYKKQMVEMQDMYKEYLKALPSTSDIPELIDGISRLGEKNNLKFGSIRVGDAKVASGFYMELPIDLVITGSYNNIGKFISDLSKLSRIVTIEDFSIKPVPVDDKNISSSGLLLMNLGTKTYWVVSQSEQTADGNPNTGATPPAKAPGMTTDSSSAPGQSPVKQEPSTVGGIPGAPPTTAPTTGIIQ